jgi:hypothetical protein
MYATAKGKTDIIKLLLKVGANPSRRDLSGRSVEQYGLTKTNFDDISACISAVKASRAQSRPSSPFTTDENASVISSVSGGSYSQSMISPIRKVLSPYNPKNAFKSTMELGGLISCMIS